MLQCLYDLVTAATRKEPAEKQTSQTTNLYIWLKQGIGWQRDCVGQRLSLSSVARWYEIRLTCPAKLQLIRVERQPNDIKVIIPDCRWPNDKKFKQWKLVMLLGFHWIVVIAHNSISCLNFLSFGCCWRCKDASNFVLPGNTASWPCRLRLRPNFSTILK